MADADVVDMLYTWNLGHYIDIFRGMYKLCTDIRYILIPIILVIL